MADNSNDDARWPIFRSLASFRPGNLPGDLIAGLTLAAIAIPEQMATSRLGGFSPQIGFFAFVAGSLGFVMFGANRFLSCGADSTITPIFAGSLAQMATSGSSDYQALAVALALEVGVLLVAGTLFRLGWVANLLSTPVTVGFLAGIAIHIIVSQLPGVLGLTSPSGPMLYGIAVLMQHLREANIYTVCIGFGVLAVVAGSEVISARIPGALIGLIVAAVAVIWGELERRGVHVIGSIPSTLPVLSFPDISPERWVRLLPLSFLIALIVMVQTAATTRSFPSDAHRPPDVDRDFFGAGVGSILSGLIGAFPVNASPPRTGIVAETGGRTQLSGLFAAAIVLALLVFGATLLRNVPHAALSGVLLFIALRIIRAKQIVTVYHQSFGEFLLIAATAAAIIVMPIEQGVAIGVALSLLQGIWSTTRARLVEFEHVPGTTVWWPAHPHAAGDRIPNVAVVGLQAPLSFLNATNFRADVLKVIRTASPKLLVLEASGVLDIDFTAAQMLLELSRECRAASITLAIARLESIRAREAFERFKLYDALPREYIFISVDAAVRALAGPK